MTRRRTSRVPKWKQLVALACGAYAVAVWVVPIFMLPLVDILPYVHERDTLARLPFSVAGSALICAVLVALNGGKVPSQASGYGNTRQKLTHWVGVVGGLMMFTFSGAALSANLFGLTARLLPHDAFTSRVTIESAEYYGSRCKSVELQYKDPDANELRHLTLSKRLFDYPRIQHGDVLELRGRRTLVGSYVHEVQLHQRANRSFDTDTHRQGAALPVLAGQLQR